MKALQKFIFLGVLFMSIVQMGFAQQTFYTNSNGSPYQYYAETEIGDGTWGAILGTSVTISGNNATFRAWKIDGSPFSNDGGTICLKVGDFAATGDDRQCIDIIGGETLITFNTYGLEQYHVLPLYGYPKDHYVRFESDVSTGGYAWTGPIWIYRDGCDDNQQNQGETDVDCGGPCPACSTDPTCFDGIQNQGEDGIDCGGPCFASCSADPTCFDGIQNQGEDGIDCGGPCPACSADPTCFDGIQNQGEDGIDCGGPCPACSADPTCFDNVQNQGEDGIDCGGPCPACIADPTCDDNIQNQGEEGVDCGGPCPACATCFDDIQNQGEEGVDCGGPCSTACPTCTDGVQNGNETGIDCGGIDCPVCQFTISGTVEDIGIFAPIGNVSINFLLNNVSTITAVSDNNGNYTATLPEGWNGTVEAELECYNFNTPALDFSTSPLSNNINGAVIEGAYLTEIEIYPTLDNQAKIVIYEPLTATNENNNANTSTSGTSFQPLFVDATTLSLVLTPEQQALVENYENLPTTANLKVVLIDFDCITSVGNLEVELFNEEVYTYARNQINTELDAYTWYGSNVDVDYEKFSFYAKNDEYLTGTLVANQTKYFILPLGNNLHVVGEYNASEAGSCGTNGNEDNIAPRLESNEETTLCSDDGNTITVLVAYTPEALADAGSVTAMENSVRQMLNNTNESYKNSKVNMRMQVVGIIETNYIEPTFPNGVHNMQQEVNDLADGNGNLAILHDLREVFAADIVHLIVSDATHKSNQDNLDTLSGLADYSTITNLDGEFTLIIKENQSFCVTKINTIGNYIFAHEMGHLQGVKHDLDKDDEGNILNYPVNIEACNNSINHTYGKGKCFDGWFSSPITTVMGTASCDVLFSEERLPYWSNPTVMFPDTDESTGETDRNNARVLNETSDIVSNFRNNTFWVRNTSNCKLTVDAITFANGNSSINWINTTNINFPFKVEAGQSQIIGVNVNWTGAGDCDRTVIASIISNDPIHPVSELTIDLIPINSTCSALFSMTEPIEILDISTEVEQPLCPYDFGSATVVATGGTAPYTYLWNTPTPQTTATAIDLEGGSYTILVTDANGCLARQVITINTPPPFVIEENLQNTTGGTSASPFIYNVDNIIVTGGTLPYSLIWDNDGYVRTSNENGNITIIYNNSASWSVTVVDAHGCTIDELQFSSTTTPTANLLIDSYDISNVTNTAGDNGAISIYVSGGLSNGNYLYDWYGESCYNNTSACDNSNTITDLQVGWYTVQVCDDVNGNGECDIDEQNAVGWYWVAPKRRGRGKGIIPYLQANPNPFSQQTNIVFSVSEDEHTTVSIFDVSGRQVATIFDDEAIANFPYQLSFDASHLSEGIYFLHINTASGQKEVKKLVVSK